MSIDPETFRQMFAASETEASDDFELSDDVQLSDVVFEEPPVRSEFIEPAIRADEPPIRFAEPPIRIEEPPPSPQELEAAAVEELMKIAAQDEKDLHNAQKALRSKDTFVIVCPNGCRIRVKEQHRGKSGKCPRCKSEFIVPKK